MFKDCISKQEITSTMKQGLVQKADKDPLKIENWGLVWLSNIDSKMFAPVYAKKKTRDNKWKPKWIFWHWI